MRVDRFGDQFLACAAFTLYQHSRAAGCHLPDQVEHGLHRFTFADDVFKTVALLQSALQLDVFRLRAMLPDGAANIGQQLLVIPRLLNESYWRRSAWLRQRFAPCRMP